MDVRWVLQRVDDRECAAGRVLSMDRSTSVKKGSKYWMSVL